MSRDPQRDYDRARDAFDDLDTGDQARFLAETTVAAVSRSVKHVSRALADELDAFFEDPAGPARQHEPSTEASDGPGPAEPPTGAQRREA